MSICLVTRCCGSFANIFVISFNPQASTQIYHSPGHRDQGGSSCALHPDPSMVPREIGTQHLGMDDNGELRGAIFLLFLIFTLSW